MHRKYMLTIHMIQDYYQRHIGKFQKQYNNFIQKLGAVLKITWSKISTDEQHVYEEWSSLISGEC